MDRHYIELWPENNTASVASDIARHLQVRQALGPAIIVTKRPAILLSSVRKQWMKLLRSLQLEQSRTLDTALRSALAKEVDAMQTLLFAAKSPNEIVADVYFIEPGVAEKIMLPPCATLYTESTPPDVFGRFLNSVSENGVAVRYSFVEK